MKPGKILRCETNNHRMYPNVGGTTPGAAQTAGPAAAGGAATALPAEVYVASAMTTVAMPNSSSSDNSDRRNYHNSISTRATAPARCSHRIISTDSGSGESSGSSGANNCNRGDGVDVFSLVVMTKNVCSEGLNRPRRDNRSRSYRSMLQ